MDKKQLTMIAGVAGAATVLGIILPWVSISIGPISQSASGLDVNTGPIILILGAAAAVLFGATALGKGDKIPMPEKTKTMVGMICIGVAALLTWLKFFDFGDGMGVASRGIGLWLCALATLAGTGAAFMLFRAGGGTGGGDGGDGGGA